MAEKDDRLQVKILKYFERIKSADELKVAYKCQIENCSKVLNGKHSTNIVKHVRRMHANFFATNIQANKSELTLPQKRLKLIQDWAEIVTVNGRSFKHLSDSGFQKSVDEKLAEVDAAGLSGGLDGPNFTAIKKRIAYLANEIKIKIKEEVNDKFVSLMIDFATKHRRSIMGVSLQFVQNGQVVTRSIGMVQTLASNTSANVLKVLMELLDSFGINKTRVISITTDNAPNLSLMVKILNENVERELENENKDDQEVTETHRMDQNTLTHQPICSHRYFDVDDIEDEIRITVEKCNTVDDSESDDELDEILNDDQDFEALIDSLKNEYATQTITVNGIKCAVHTLQLAVRDSLCDKELNIRYLIDLCRIVCKTLRKQSYQFILEENNIEFKFPRLDCMTRWCSTYNMVRERSSFILSL